MPQNDIYHVPKTRLATPKAIARAVAFAWLASVLLAALLLTQIAAHRMGYHRLLGEPWLILSPEIQRALLPAAGCFALAALAAACLLKRRRVAALPLAGLAIFLALLAWGPLYTPIHLGLWFAEFRVLPEPEALLRNYLVALLAFATLAAVVAFVAFVRRLEQNRQPAHTHGSAHWATHRQVQQAGLLGHRGLLLGTWTQGWRPRYLRDDGPEHVLLFAPTRSGKGAGIVIPNLLTWPHSVLVHDIKGENWNHSANWRAQELGSRCLRFDPTDVSGSAARYNPLDAVRLGHNEVRDAQNIADILVDPNGDRHRDHWDRAAHAFLTALVLHVVYFETQKNLAGCLEILSRPDDTIDQTLEFILTAPHDPAHHQGWRNSAGQLTATHPAVSAATRNLLDKSDRERSAVLSSVIAFLSLYRDPAIADNTATSDFRIEDLVYDSKPLSLYLAVPTSDLSRTRPLVRLLLNQALRRLTEELPGTNDRLRHPLLLMIDEFPALGRLAFLQDALAHLAGYGIRAVLVTQDLSQLYAAYGHDEAITSNCRIRIAFAPNKPETARLVSELLGDQTLDLESLSWQIDQRGRRATISQHQLGRRLLTPDETMRLPAEDELVFVAGMPPIKAKKIRYYVGGELKRRALL